LRFFLCRFLYRFLCRFIAPLYRFIALLMPLFVPLFMPLYCAFMPLLYRFYSDSSAFIIFIHLATSVICHPLATLFGIFCHLCTARCCLSGYLLALHNMLR
jgi:ABC-type sulfate transport system permease subunit